MDIVVSKNSSGFFAKVKNIQGAFAEGDTPYEAIYNLMDVMDMISQYRNQKFSQEKFEKEILFSIPKFA